MWRESQAKQAYQPTARRPRLRKGSAFTLLLQYRKLKTLNYVEKSREGFTVVATTQSQCCKPVVARDMPGMNATLSQTRQSFSVTLRYVGTDSKQWHAMSTTSYPEQCRRSRVPAGPEQLRELRYWSKPVFPNRLRPQYRQQFDALLQQFLGWRTRYPNYRAFYYYRPDNPPPPLLPKV